MNDTELFAITQVRRPKQSPHARPSSPAPSTSCHMTDAIRIRTITSLPWVHVLLAPVSSRLRRSPHQLPTVVVDLRTRLVYPRLLNWYTLPRAIDSACLNQPWQLKHTYLEESQERFMTREKAVFVASVILLGQHRSASRMWSCT